MSMLTFENPVFRTYALAAALMLVKMMTHSWITVYRMLKVNAGFRNPEDLRKTPMNPNPSPQQLDKNEYVERSRRIHQNELENTPVFVATGLLYVCCAPSYGLAFTLFAIYVFSRLVHFGILMAEGTHDARAVAWTIGSLIIYFMAGTVIVRGVQALAA